MMRAQKCEDLSQIGNDPDIIATAEENKPKDKDAQICGDNSGDTGVWL